MASTVRRAWQFAPRSSACGFHTFSVRLKNPYYLYDLMGKQPIGPRAELLNFGSHFMFDPTANMPKEDMSQRVKRVFGDLASRDASRQEAQAKAISVEGIRVPAKPEEPTNCCMSGCVNCVWELYKDEIEEWKAQVAAARRVLLKPENRSKPWPMQLGKPPQDRSITSPEEEGEFDDGLNTGIRVFIDTEKKLKARRRAQQGSPSPASPPTHASPNRGSGSMPKEAQTP